MDRRTFLHYGSFGMGAMMLSQGLWSKELWAQNNAAALTALENKPLTTIAFGSCNRSHLNQSYWRLIGLDRPDLWIWLGDTIYGDRDEMDERKLKYQTLKNNPYYKDFREEVPVIGTWDDHDYASGNMDGDFPEKIESKEALLNFLDVPQDSPVWNHKGVYQSYVFGPPGQRTQVILLDLRFNMKKSLTRKVLLGEDQWQWLGEQLASSTADLLIIGSSLNVTSPIAGLGIEGWKQYGSERKRFYELIARRGLPTIILSGDRHFGELTRIALPNGQPVYEAMSSGLTHSFGVKLPHPGRLADMVGSRNYGALLIEWTNVGPKVRMQIKSTEQYATFREAVADFRGT